MAILRFGGRALLVIVTYSAATTAECVSLISAAAAASARTSSKRVGGGVSFHRTSPDSLTAQAAKALKALDTDSSGKVERSEVEAFGRQNGLTASQLAAEFQGLDTNGDGELGSDEITRALGSDTANAAGSASRTASADVNAGGEAAPSPVPVSASAHASVSAPAALPREEGVIVESSPSVAAPTNDDPFQKSAVMQEARSEAGAVLAEAFEGSASSSLKEQQQGEVEATELESRAKSLRGKAATLSSTAKQQTAAAAAAAAEAVLEEVRAQVKQLEQNATAFELEARDRREKARRAMERVSKATNEMNAMMQ